jgi:hypothetical protein
MSDLEPRRPRRAIRWMKRAAVSLALAYAALVAALNACSSSPLRTEPVERRSGEPVTDGSLELARRYAPWIYHEVDATRGRQDLPAPLDFDGNLSGDDNWETFARCEFVPTAYYAHLETATHHFLTYHLFHPRDWEPIELGLHLTHEGDGENLQVVVEKASGEVVLLFAQAHYRGEVYANDRDAFASGRRPLYGLFLTFDDDGVPRDGAAHAAVFVEARGHGIYGAIDDDSRVAVGSDGRARFERAGIVFRPARAGEPVGEPALDVPTPVPYQLESTTAKIWPGVRSGELVGDGKLLDVVVPYSDARVSLALPKFHRGNRFSGPLGPSRGISPFAVDFGWSAGTLGALFFDPARRYAESLRVPQPWSLEYVDYPFATRQGSNTK